jgi:secreted trypsin-like serine protease
MKIFLLLIVACFSCLNIFAGTIDPEVSDSKYIEYGKKFTYIYKICGTNHDSKMFCGSAVAIEPNWVLTAAHVVKEAKFCLISQEETEKGYVVDKIIVREGFEENNFGFNDIALCYISNDLQLNFYPPLYENEDEIGKICCMSGYGLTGTFDTGAVLSDDKKRAGSNRIDSVDRELLICSPSRTDKTSLEFLICIGDSGGGLFVDGKLAGINSCVFASDKNPNSTYGDESGHTRISKHIKWIRNTIKNYKHEKKTK